MKSKNLENKRQKLKDKNWKMKDGIGTLFPDFYLLIPTLLFIISSCHQPSHSENTLTRIGTLMSIMHQGQLSANIKLDTVNLKNVWGLGALDSLRGEVLILDGKPYKSFVVDSTSTIEIDVELEASLLVYTVVNEWDTLLVSKIDDLDWLIKTKLDERKVTKPSPFLLIGNPDSLDYHVINFDSRISDISEHKEGAFNGSLSNEEVTILGFYSTKDKGIFTHHDSNLHMHVMNEQKSVMGHIDSFEAGNNSFILLFPKQ